MPGARPKIASIDTMRSRKLSRAGDIPPTRHEQEIEPAASSTWPVPAPVLPPAGRPHQPGSACVLDPRKPILRDKTRRYSLGKAPEFRYRWRSSLFCCSKPPASLYLLSGSLNDIAQQRLIE